MTTDKKPDEPKPKSKDKGPVDPTQPDTAEYPTPDVEDDDPGKYQPITDVQDEE